MITINPFRLATLIDHSEPLDLIDVRTEKEFKSFHIAGARSVPLKKLSAPKVLQDRKRAATEPLYIIGNGRVRASLVAGILDRKSTRLNSSHANISYAVFCLKKKKRIVM